MSAPQLNAKHSRYLVIKHGGLEEFLLAMGAFKAISDKQQGHHITLLTTEPFVALAKDSGYFHEVVADPIVPAINFTKFWKFLKALRNAKFDAVYDLQCDGRTELYFRFWGRKKPQWNGHISWCSHPYISAVGIEHVLDWQEAQLAVAGVTEIPVPDISFMKADIAPFDLPKRIALIMAAGTEYNLVVKDQRGKDVLIPSTWSDVHFIELMRWYAARDIMPVFIGTEADAFKADSIISLAGGIPGINLCGQVGIREIAELSRIADSAIGNDNEALWISALTGCPTMLIFPSFGDFRQRSPRGAHVRIAYADDLDSLSGKDVIRTLSEIVRLDTTPETVKAAIIENQVIEETR